ncbi:hypothetical protein V8E54_013717 [Elaphomyces granulatus]
MPTPTPKILRPKGRLASQHEVDKHLQSGVQETLESKKKRRQRGKRLNLVREAKVAAEEAGKEAKKAQAAENKQGREVGAQEMDL